MQILAIICRSLTLLNLHSTYEDLKSGSRVKDMMLKPRKVEGSKILLVPYSR
jgi:hypothetical protein